MAESVDTRCTGISGVCGHEVYSHLGSLWTRGVPASRESVVTRCTRISGVCGHEVFPRHEVYPHLGSLLSRGVPASRESAVTRCTRISGVCGHEVFPRHEVYPHLGAWEGVGYAAGLRRMNSTGKRNTSTFLSAFIHWVSYSGFPNFSEIIF
jgi:hypothetical protein